MKWSDPEQELFDLGFQLAELLERSDQGSQDQEACEQLYASLEKLRGKIKDAGTLVNLLSCQLLLGFVATSLDLAWVERCAFLADNILEMLPMIIANEVNKTIFPLTCVLWHYRDDSAKHSRAVAMMASVAESRKVRFARKQTYAIKFLIPKIARDSPDAHLAHEKT